MKIIYQTYFLLLFVLILIQGRTQNITDAIKDDSVYCIDIYIDKSAINLPFKETIDSTSFPIVLHTVLHNTTRNGVAKAYTKEKKLLFEVNVVNDMWLGNLVYYDTLVLHVNHLYASYLLIPNLYIYQVKDKNIDSVYNVYSFGSGYLKKFRYKLGDEDDEPISRQYTLLKSIHHHELSKYPYTIQLMIQSLQLRSNPNIIYIPVNKRLPLYSLYSKNYYSSEVLIDSSFNNHAYKVGRITITGFPYQRYYIEVDSFRYVTRIDLDYHPYGNDPYLFVVNDTGLVSQGNFLQKDNHIVLVIVGQDYPILFPVLQKENGIEILYTRKTLIGNRKQNLLVTNWDKGLILHERMNLIAVPNLNNNKMQIWEIKKDGLYYKKSINPSLSFNTKSEHFNYSEYFNYMASVFRKLKRR